jgi:hypothetical protein
MMEHQTMGALKSTLHTASIALAVATAVALASLGATSLVDPSFVRGTMGGGLARVGMTLGGASAGPYFPSHKADGPSLQRSLDAAPNSRPRGKPESTPVAGALASMAER